MSKIHATIIITISLFLTSCFTGVESTPRITYSDVKKEKITITSEERFLSDIKNEKPSEWTKGKRFYITDDKISLAMNADNTNTATQLKGQHMTFEEMRPVTSVTGDEVAELTFTTDSGDRLCYRPETPYEDLIEKEELDIPFAIEEDLVNKVKCQLTGNTYYITTPIWYDADGNAQQRCQRHVAVKVTDVQPGNSNYPLRVVFEREGDPQPHSIYMTIGDKRTSTRNFSTLFAFDNPRKKYPNISDDDWALIINSKVKPGMTKDECRLALGTPHVHGQRPTTAGMIEYWQYSEGIYLVFEEGLLAAVK